jgi:hypothetical protein
MLPFDLGLQRGGPQAESESPERARCLLGERKNCGCASVDCYRPIGELRPLCSPTNRGMSEHDCLQATSRELWRRIRNCDEHG